MFSKLKSLILKNKRSVSKNFIKQYKRNFKFLKKNSGDFKVFKEFRYDAGIHPEDHKDYECKFAAYHIAKLNPKNILDVGSYRHFILGMLSRSNITTIDIRDREPALENEVVITGDVKNLQLPDNSFDAVVSLCALEHFGLGRYGDEFDLNADKKAFKEIVRVLKPGGHLIFTTAITRAQPCIVFNAGRIYNYEMIKTFCSNLISVEEKFYNQKNNNFCSFEQITQKSGVWNMYCGCWKKP